MHHPKNSNASNVDVAMAMPSFIYSQCFFQLLLCCCSYFFFFNLPCLNCSKQFRVFIFLSTSLSSEILIWIKRWPFLCTHRQAQWMWCQLKFLVTERERSKLLTSLTSSGSRGPCWSVNAASLSQQGGPLAALAFTNRSNRRCESFCETKAAWKRHWNIHTFSPRRLQVPLCCCWFQRTAEPKARDCLHRAEERATQMKIEFI